MPACRDADYIPENALAISVNAGDMPTPRFLTLPSSVSNAHPSTGTMTNEEDTSCKALFLHRLFLEAEHVRYLARSESPGLTLFEVGDP